MDGINFHENKKKSTIRDKKNYYMEWEPDTDLWSIIEDIPPCGWAVFRGLPQDHAASLVDYLQGVEDRLHDLETRDQQT